MDLYVECRDGFISDEATGKPLAPEKGWFVVDEDGRIRAGDPGGFRLEIFAIESLNAMVAGARRRSRAGGR